MKTRQHCATRMRKPDHLLCGSAFDPPHTTHNKGVCKTGFVVGKLVGCFVVGNFVGALLGNAVG